jgi:hypothetical protein
VQVTRLRSRLRDEAAAPHPNAVHEAVGEPRDDKHCTAEKSALVYYEHTDLQVKKALLDAQYNELLAPEQEAVLPEWKAAMANMRKKSLELEDYLKVCPHVLKTVPILYGRSRSVPPKTSNPGPNNQPTPKEFTRKLHEIKPEIEKRRKVVFYTTINDKNCTTELITTTKREYTDLQVKKALLNTEFGTFNITIQEELRAEYSNVIKMLEDEMVDQEIFLDKCKVERPSAPGDILPPSKPKDINKKEDIVQIYHRKVTVLNYTLINFTKNSNPVLVQRASDITKSRKQCDQKLRAELMVENIYLSSNRTRIQQEYEGLILEDRTNLVNTYLAAISEIDRQMFEIEAYFRACPFEHPVPHNTTNHSQPPVQLSHRNTSNNTHPDHNNTTNQSNNPHNQTHITPIKNQTVPVKPKYVPKPRKTWPEDPRQPTPAMNCNYPVNIQYEPEVVRVPNDLPILKKELQELMLKSLDTVADLEELKRGGKDQDFKKKHTEYVNLSRQISALKDQLRFLGHQQPVSVICHNLPRITQPRNHQEIASIENSFYIPQKNPHQPQERESAHHEYQAMSKIMDGKMAPHHPSAPAQRRTTNLPTASHPPTHSTPAHKPQPSPHQQPQPLYYTRRQPDQGRAQPGQTKPPQSYKVTVNTDVQGNTIAAVVRRLLTFEPSADTNTDTNTGTPTEPQSRNGMFRSNLGDHTGNIGSTVAGLAQSSFHLLNIQASDPKKTN